MTYTLSETTARVMEMLGLAGGPSPEYGDTRYPDDAKILEMRFKGYIPLIGSELIRQGSDSEVADGEEIRPEVRFTTLPGGTAAELRLDADVIRVCGMKMKSWQRESISIYEPESSGWERQWSAEPGTAGTAERPMCYLTEGKEGKLLRGVGSKDESDTLEWLHVWKIPTPTADGRFSFPAALYPELTRRLSVELGMIEGE